MGTGVHSTCCKLVLLTSTLGFQTTLPHGGYTVEVQGCPCLEQQQLVPPRPCQVLPHPPPLSLPPLSLSHSHPCGSPFTRAQTTLLLAQPGPLLSLEDLGPHGAWGPISTHLNNYTLWETQYSLGSCPQLTLNTFSIFGFIYWSSLRCFFKTSTVAFKKTEKPLCSILRIKSSFSTLK